MRYILNPYIALRSWMLVPYAYYIKGERNAKGLTAEPAAPLSEPLFPSDELDDHGQMQL